MKKNLIFWTTIMLVLSWTGLSIAGSITFETIPTRPGVTQNFVLMTPQGKVTKTAVFCLPGGVGVGAMKKQPDGTVGLSKNFACRTAFDVAKAGFTAVIMDVPSDATWQATNKLSKGDLCTDSDNYRRSDKQLADFQAVMDYLRKQGAQNFFIFSYSRSGISNMTLASQMGKKLKGIILVSSIQATGFVTAENLDKIKVPVLIIHHEKDRCNLNGYDEALVTAKLLKNAKVTVKTITGGYTPMGEDDCQPISYHGFFGVEPEATNTMIKWLKAH